MRLTILPSESIINTGFNIKVSYDYTDVDDGAGNTTLTKQILPEPGTTGTNPAGLAVLRAGHRTITAFDSSDAAINSLLIEVGDGGDTDRFLAQTQTAADGSYVTYKVTANVVDTLPHAYTATDTIDALWTVAGGANPTLGEITSGAGEIYLWVVDLRTLADV